jgi:predicted XRE-type DNA-binding protein
MTSEIAEMVWKLRENTDLLQHQIAAALDINQGRVSEVLSGKRFPRA